MDVGEITAGMRLGRGSLMAKLDVQMHTTLYQSIRRIAGCRVLNEVVPFMSIWSCPSAVRSAPYIFTCIADLVEWVAKRKYDVISLMHHLDDLVLPAPLSVNTIWKCLLTVFLNLETPPSRQTRRAINLPNHSGIKLDSLNVQARLAQDKCDRITALLEKWSQKRWLKRKELKSLIAHLQLACMVILQGRSFLCQMMNLLCAFRPYDHLICLNQAFFHDLARKQEVFQSWNGCSFLQYPQWTLLADFEVSSDASGALGYGAVARVTGFQAPRTQNRSLSPSSTITFSLSSWQPTSGVSLWAFKRVNVRKFCGLELQEPPAIMS